VSESGNMSLNLTANSDGWGAQNGSSDPRPANRIPSLGISYQFTAGHWRHFPRLYSECPFLALFQIHICDQCALFRATITVLHSPQSATVRLAPSICPHRTCRSLIHVTHISSISRAAVRADNHIVSQRTLVRPFLAAMSSYNSVPLSD
jgi:hypothetical protein